MSDVYQLITADASPVDLAEMKAYLKKSSAADDALIQSLINACTDWGENYTGREFRANQWALLLDCFSTRIGIRRNPVDAIDSVKYLVSGSDVTVDSAVYYLKHGVQSAEILLDSGEYWPSDGDDREQSITIAFTTKSYRRIEEIKNGIKRHVAYLYFNRGDCPTDLNASESGALSSYSSIRIARV